MVIARANRPRLPCDHGNPSDTWSSYPRQAEPTQSHISCVFNSFCDLSDISVDANALVFKDGRKHPRKELEQILDGIRKRLETWKAGLPECISLENATVSQTLSLQ